MWKKVVTVGLLLTAGVAAVKYSSYAGTLWHNLCKSAAQQVPRGFKIDEVRYQIAQLDAEIEAAHGPIAEKMAEAQELRAQVQAGRASLAKQAKSLEALTSKVEAGEEHVVLDQARLTTREARAKMTRDLRHFRETKALLEQKEKHLKAVEETVAQAKQTLAQMRAERAEFARQLAEIELREQKIRHEQSANTARKGSGLSAQIKSNLANLKRGQAVDENRSKLAREFDPPGDEETPAEVQATPEEVRRALDGRAAEPAPQGGKKAE